MQTVRRGAQLFVLGVIAVASACVGSRRVDRVLVSPQYKQVLETRSEYLKVHMRDGSLFILTQWQASAGMKGLGARLNAKRDTIERGMLTVPLDSVLLFETNRVHSNPKSAFAAFTVITGVVALLCAANPKACFGSCPTFYAGDNQHILAEGFSSSIAPALEATDIDKLEVPVTHDSTFTLRMTNEALETHVIRSVRLLTFPFVAGQPVYAGKDGFWRVASGVLPRCTFAGGSCTDAIAAVDRKEWFSAADSTDLAAREDVRIEFDVAEAGKYGLVLTSRQTLLHTYVLYQTLAFMGTRAGEYLAALGRGDQRVMGGVYNLGRTLGGIEIGNVDGDGRLETVLETGPLATDSHVIPLGDLTAGSHFLNLRMAKGHWRIDRVGIVRLAERVTPTAVESRQVTHNGKPFTVTYPISSLPGDEYRFEFAIKRNSEIFLEARGYYLEWMRSEWLKEENAQKAELMLYQPALGLKMLAPDFKKWEPRMEELFWNSRYVRN